MPNNMPPPPEFLVPPQPTAQPYGPPPAYSESVFGQGKVALDDEDGKDAGNAGFVPRYVFYNGQQGQAPPLPAKNATFDGPNSRSNSMSQLHTSPIGSGVQVSYPNQPPSYTASQPPVPYPNSNASAGQLAPYPTSTGPYPPQNIPYPTSVYNMSGLQANLPSYPVYPSSTSTPNPNAPPLTPEEEPDLNILKPSTHL